MASADYVPIATSELERMAKGPTAWPAWALREALNELVRRRHAEEPVPPPDRRRPIDPDSRAYDWAMEAHDASEAARGFRKAGYCVFFGEPGAVGDPLDVLRDALGHELVGAEALGDSAFGLLFAKSGPLAALNDPFPVLTPNRMLGYEDQDMPYDRYQFEVGFVRDLVDQGEASAVLDLARRLRGANLPVMVDRDGQDVVPLGS